MPTVTGDNFFINKHTLQFRTGESSIASIAYDKTQEEISISNAGTGSINIGDAGGDIFIGDGSVETDIVFEQNGSIRALANKTLKLGQSDSDVKVNAQNFIVSGDASFSGAMTINGNPVMTGASDLDTDTLQTVTDRGEVTTNSIGIGTTSANGLLQVGKYTIASQGNQGTYGNLSSFANSDTDNIFLGLKNGSYPNRGFAFRTVANGVNCDFTIYEHGQGSAEVFRISSIGNVSIGNTSAGAKLDIRTDSSTTNGVTLRAESSTGAYFRLYHGGALDTEGNITAPRFIQDTNVGNNFYAAGFTRSSSSLDNPDIYDLNGYGLVLGATSSENTLTIDTGNTVLVKGGSEPDTNSYKADFAVGVGTNPQISWRNQQVQIGGTDMNWAGKIYHDGMFNAAAWASHFRLFTQSSNSTPYDIIFSPWNGSSVSEAMRILGEGRVGIGTNNPASLLHVSSESSESELRIESDNGNGDPFLHFKLDGGSSYSIGIDDDDSNAFKISRNATLGTNDILKVDSTTAIVYNNLLVGEADGTLDGSRLEVWTTNSQSPFSITNTTNSNRKVLDSAFNSNHPRFSIFNASATETIRLETNGDSFFNGGDVGIGTTSPTFGKLEIYKNGADTELCIHEDAGTHEARLHLRRGGSDWEIINNNHLTLEIEGSEIVRFRSDGKVGIGLSDPDQTLDVGGNIRIPNQGKIVFGSAGTTPSDYLQLYDVGAGNPLLKLVQDGAERFSIEGVNGNVYMQGNVGIGITNPATKLQIDNGGAGTVDSAYSLAIRGDGIDGIQIISDASNQGRIVFGDNSNNSIGRINYDHSDDSMSFRTNGSEKVYITSAGSVGIGSSNPSSKLEVQTSSVAGIVTGLLIHNNVATTSTAGNGVGIVMGRAGGVYSSKIANVWTNNNPSFLQTNIAFYTMHDSFAAGSETEKMRLTSQGRLGIGLTNPSQRLEVYTNTDVSAQIGRAHIGHVGFGDHAGFAHLDNATTSNYSLLQSSAGDTFINTPASRQIYFRKGNTTIGGFNGDSDFYVDTDTLYVDSSEGRVGIGVSDPDATLEVKGAGNSNATTSLHVRDSDDQKLFMVRNDGVVTVEHNYFYASASAGAYVQTDLRVRGSLSNDAGTLAIHGDVNFDSNTLYVDSTNNRVGVGLTAPSTPLHVKGNIRAEASSSTAFADFKSSQVYASSAYDIIVGSNNSLNFRTNDTRRMTILGGGNVGIGTTNPDELLRVVGGNICVTNGQYLIFDGAGSKNHKMRSYYDGSQGHVEIIVGGTDVIDLAADGNVGIGSTSPSAPLDIKAAVANNAPLLKLRNENNSNGASIQFIDQSTALQPANITYKHADGLSQGGGASFHFTGEADLTLVVGNSTNKGRMVVSSAGSASEADYGFYDDVNMGMSRITTDDLALITAGQQRLRIDPAGDVGIGITNPTSKLHVKGPINITRTANSDTSNIDMEGNFRFSAQNGYRTTFFNNGSERVRFDVNGHVGIGTTSPDTLLHLQASDPVLKVRDSSTTTNSATLWLQESDTYGVKINYQSNGGDKGRDYLTIDTLSAADGNNQAGNHDNAWGIDQDGYVMPHKGAVDGNLLKSYEWLLYGPQVSGSTPSFPRNGLETENARIYGHNPFGEPAILWYTPNQDSSDNDDGGWNSDTFIVDRGKSYRTSVWVKKETDTPADGNLYLGTNYVNNLNGTYNTNPYFLGGNTLNTFGETGQWYLFVGYIFDSGHTGTSNHPKGGIYDRNGRKLASANSFKFTDSGDPSDGLSSNFNTSRQRVYNYYDSNTGSKTYWWGPRFEPLEASTPTLKEILNTPTSDTGASFMGSVGVGINTHSQTNEVKLHVYKNANRATTIVQNNNHVARFEAYGTATAIDTTASNGVIIRNNGSNKVHFDAGGNVGIGADDPDTKLEVQTSVGAPMLHLRPNAASTAINPIILYRNQLEGSANYMLCQGVSTFFGTYEGGAPTDPSDMIKLQPNTSANPQLHIGDAGSSAATLNVGGNIKLLNNGTSYINGGNFGIGTTSPSKFSVRGGMSDFETTLTNNDDWQNSPISILERDNVGLNQSADKYSPNLNFHWGGRVSNSLWMGANGQLNWGSYSAAGIPSDDGTFNVGTININGNIVTQSSKFIGLGATLAAVEFGDGTVGNESADLSFVTNSDGEFTFYRGENKLIIGSTTNVVNGDFLVDTDTLYVDVSTDRVGIGVTNPSNTLDVAGGAEFNAETYIRAQSNAGLRIQTIDQGITSNDGIRLGLNATHAFLWNLENKPLALATNNQERLTILQGGDVGIGTTSPATKLDVNGDVTITNKLIHAGDTNTYLAFETDTFRMFAAGEEMIKFNSSKVTINEAAGNNDLQVKGNTIDNLVYVDGSADKVGINTNSPDMLLTVEGKMRSVSNMTLGSDETFGGTYGAIGIGTTNLTNGHHRIFAKPTDHMYFAASSNKGFRFRPNGGTSTASAGVTIASDGDVGIGTTSPASKLEVQGTIQTKVYSISSLPSASPAGQRAMVNNSYYTFGSAVLGQTVYAGGSAVAPVYSDGSYWRYG